jgi:hypothetical protein
LIVSKMIELPFNGVNAVTTENEDPKNLNAVPLDALKLVTKREKTE